MHDISRLLGLAVRAQRSRRGFSQEELAFRAGLHRTYITDIERGARNPSIASIAKLATALRLSLTDLFERAGSHQKGIQPEARGAGSNRSLLDEQSADILLVEDDPDSAELAIRALRKCNFDNRIHLARDGVEACEFLFGAQVERRKGKRPGVILLDLRLPKMDGVEVLRHIRSHSHTRAIPVVVLTASQDERDLEECLKLDVTDYIIKPMDFAKFSLTMPRLGFHWLLLKRPPTRRLVRA
jgi:CheY-like chemotaxis protein/DNA-binding XRE family transcriptional regulator